MTSPDRIQQLMDEMHIAMPPLVRRPEPDDALTDEPIDYSLAPEHQHIPYELVGDQVRPILSLADARLVVSLAQQALVGLSSVSLGHSRAAGRAAAAHVTAALDDAWLAR